MKNELGHEIIDAGEGENVVPFPGQQSPARQERRVNELGHEIIDEPNHGAKLVQGAQTPPDKAAKVINLSSKTKVPAPVVALDPDKHDRDYDLSQAMKLSERNPHIKNYINNVPLASSVSKGDWSELDEFSLSLEALKPKGERQGGMWGAIKNIPEIATMFGSQLGRDKLVDALIQTPVEIVKGMLEVAAIPGNVASGSIDLRSREGLEAAINMGLFVALGQAGKAKGAGLGRDIRFGTAEVSSPAEMAEFFGRIRGMKTRVEIDEFLAGKAEVQPPSMLRITDAKHSAEGLKASIERANATNTKKISAEALEQFAEQAGNVGKVHIPASTILELYRSQGKVPMKGDGLFGFVPGLAEKLQLAAEAETEIVIPTSRYVTNIEPELHTKIADVVRVHEKGTTLKEAKELEVTAEEEAKSLKEQEERKAKETAIPATMDPLEAAKLQRETLEGLEKKRAAEQLGEAFKDDPILGTLDPDRAAAPQQKPPLLVVARLLPDGSVRAGKPGQVHTDLMSKEELATSSDSPEVAASMGYASSDGKFLTRAKALEFAEANEPARAAFSSQQPQFGLDAATYNEATKPGAVQEPVSTRGKIGAEKHKAVIANTTIDAQGKVRKSLYLDPLFTQGKDVNIPQTEFAKYSNTLARANEIILEKAVAFAEKEVAKRLTPQWRNHEAAVRDEVLSELYADPSIKLDRFLRTGSMQPDGGIRSPGERMKLNRADVEAIAGKDALEGLTSETGADLSVVAKTFGFASKEEMVKGLVDLKAERTKLDLHPKEHVNHLAKMETAKRMEERYGKLEQNIALEASEIALASFNVDLLSAEWRMLAEMAGEKPPLNRGDMTKWAAEQFGKAEQSQVSYETFRRAAEKWGREAEKALLAKKYDDAFRAKQTQMLNFLLAREAKAFEKDVVGKNERLMEKYTGEDNVPAVDQTFTDQIHALMLQYGVKISRTPENVEYNLGGKQLSSFLDERIGQGDLLIKPDLPIPGTVKLEDFTVDQYRDFAKLLQNLDHAGRRAKQIEVAGKKEDYFQAIDQIAKNLDVLEKKGFDPDKIGPISSLRKAGRYIDAKLLKAETLINWMDLNNPMGAATQSIHRGLIEGQYKVGFMVEKLAKMIKALPSDRAWGKALNEVPDAKGAELLDWETREPLRLTNENKVSIALNYGNKGNRRVMLEGHKWTEAEVEAYLEKTMTPMDWKVVDAIHGLFEPLAPLVEETTRKRSGLAVPLVEPTPFMGSKGGYYPLVENPRDVLLKAKQQTDLFDKAKFDPFPMANALHQRTGAVYRLDFSLGRIHSVLGQTTHAVYMQEPVINANKVIKDPIIREGLAKAFGPEYVGMFDTWIKDIANNGGLTDSADWGASWISRNLRESVVTALMGWKVSTALIHGGSAAAASVYETGKMHLAEKGPKSFALAPLELIKNMKDLGLGQYLPNEAKRFFSSDTAMWAGINEVMAESQELPNRVRTIQKDFGFQLDKVFNKNFVDDLMMLRAAHNSYAMSLVSYLDLLTATIVYKSAKAKALVEGHANADAVFLADKAVREAHGSASLVSRANIGRGELNKWLTIAYNGYWNHNYNKMRQVGFEGVSPERAAQFGEAGAEKFTAGQRVALVGAFITAMFVAGAVVHHAVRGEVHETDEGAVLGALASQAAGMFPLVNSMMYSILHNRDPSISPIEEAMRQPVRAFRDLMREEPKHPVKSIAKTTGILFGFPTNQVIDLATALREVAEGEQDPQTPGDWARLVITGKAEPKQAKR